VYDIIFTDGDNNMDKKKFKFNNGLNENEISNSLKGIKYALYIIVLVLVLNMVVFININNNISKLSGVNNIPEEQEEIPEYDVSAFKQVSYSEYEDLISSKGTHVIYIGRDTCGFCAMFIPVMEAAQEKYGFTTNYLDISTVFDFEKNSVINQTAYDKMSTFNDFFEENFLATPMVVIFKDGKYVDGTMGYQEIDAYSSFLEKNNFKAK